MAGTIGRIVAALCAGRPPRAVLARVQVAFGLAALLYASACVFLILEPLS